VIARPVPAVCFNSSHQGQTRIMQVVAMIAQIDLDGGGTVSFDEFVQVRSGGWYFYTQTT
jgi:hypothetical protein